MIDFKCLKLIVSLGRTTHTKKAMGVMYHPTQLELKDSDLENVAELYGKFKTPGENGSASDDVVAVIAQGPPPNQPFNKNAEVAFNFLKTQRTSGHRLQNPKVGTIRYAQADILARSKSKTAFQGRCEDQLIFTKESKYITSRKPMIHLNGGDTYYNEWPVTCLPFAKLARCTRNVHDKIFATEDCDL